MRIAFVGKGGSGKTTLSALFTQFARDKGPLLAIDADLNMHLGALLGITPEVPHERHLSHPSSVKSIKEYFRGENMRIEEMSHFRKTTPPTGDSRFVVLHDREDPLLKKISAQDSLLSFVVVGTYDTDDIGSSCYHNNLAILENILSHLIDSKGLVVADMVAGVDAFANTLHAQFDMLVLVVEPTKRGIEVFNQYQKLAEDAEVETSLFVVGNKIRGEADMQFIREHIPEEKLLGFLCDSEYLRKKDQEGGPLSIDFLEEENKKLLEKIYDTACQLKPDFQKRIEHLYKLHRRYVAQDFIRERFGDLTDQIDESFDLGKVIKKYEGK